LAQCRQIEAIEERVRCYDEIVDSLPASDAVPDAQSLFGRDDAEAKRIVETTLAIEQIDHVEAVVTEVQKSATRKLLVTLDNGQVWRQLDNQTLRLKSGESVIIRKASLNSFLMGKKSGGRSIRVKRAN
jgi:mannose-6-phosphate isomerase class I